jgi:uncharacterized protein (TIGR02757 family)
MSGLKEGLDALYRAYNRRAYVHPDPLEFLYRYQTPGDQEIAGLISACLAYGRVAQILTSVGRVLDGMESPRSFLLGSPEGEIERRYERFVHRFTSGKELSAFLVGVKRAIDAHGSLENLFTAGIRRSHETVLPALALFVDALRVLSGGSEACPSLLSSPSDGSACKRLNLFLRWMARRDAVDPGPWRLVPRAKLVVPLDTHLFRIAGKLGLTARRQANLRTALEITRAFAEIRPRDPVRYDFALTRLAINPACRDVDVRCLLEGHAP